MIEWKVEELELLGRDDKAILKFERQHSREDKIAFVDSIQDGKLSYLLDLIAKFESEQDTMPKDNYGNIKTISLKAWLKRNDSHKIIDDWFRYGEFNFLGVKRHITNNTWDLKQRWDTYSSLVDEIFHKQVLACVEMEQKYFIEHDEYSILKEQLKNYCDYYSTTFNVSISFWGSGKVCITNGDDEREITIEEIKMLLEKFKKLEEYDLKLSTEIHITY